ncbi:TetR/AcrR family transcriptional regulator [Candidatus Gracilibacteria bacterium]|jgi:AcrR family transcriptional regulator|nr:TetR/AcrR family transcriptional regulator [Candidatus Gracilibacteria bacterium]NJM88877.1 TetR/AcrR family transcriptional regulator [Hydrococcus sp. RU_2_2]NJQ98227.1 TetR/AcrR family transcriptional regulator [Hydrococcus sp. CSU_1_8]
MSSKKTYHHGDLRQALIEEAIALVTEQGISNWSLREVARRIGVSHTAPYRHFADRDALLAAVAEKGFQKMSQFLLASLENIPNQHSQKLQAIGIAYVKYAIAHPSEYEVMFRYSQNNDRQYPALTEVSTKAFTILVNVIEEGQKAGEFRQENPTQLAYVAWSMVHGLSMLLIDGQIEVPENSTLEKIASFTTQIAIEGLMKVTLN